VLAVAALRGELTHDDQALVAIDEMEAELR